MSITQSSASNGSTSNLIPSDRDSSTTSGLNASILSSSSNNNTTNNNESDISHTDQSIRGNNNGGPKNKLVSTGTILDSIHEKCTNIENKMDKADTNKALHDAIKDMAVFERNTRESTITFRHTDEVTTEVINNVIEEEWGKHNGLAIVSSWTDKEFTYVQFLTQIVKQSFIEAALRQRNSPNNRLFKLLDLALPPTSSGYHFKRKEVKLEISGARPTIVSKRIDNLMSTIKTKEGTIITPIREGKLFGKVGNQIRSLMLRTNNEGFRVIFDTLFGVIPYNSRTRLYTKVNVKPWSCRDCFHVGPNHQCRGKLCANCSGKGHTTKECRSNVRWCNNCRQKGHKSKDVSCPIYTREIIKELRRVDIPLEYFENDLKRHQLIGALILS